MELNNNAPVPSTQGIDDVEAIKNRIKAEYDKYKDSSYVDWIEMAARKLHSAWQREQAQVNDGVMSANILKIQCSAIWFDDGKERTHNPKNIKTGIVACGLRHCNCFTILFELFADREYLKANEETLERRTIQGFLTNAGTFVDRKDGYKIALAAGQCTKSNQEILMSEDLY